MAQQYVFVMKGLSKTFPGGKQIPFCAYNSIGYREQARTQLEAMEPERRRARASGETYQPRPIVFSFGDGRRS